MITSSFLPSERYVCRVGLLERLALHTPYPAIAARISAIVRRLPRVYTTVIVDRAGRVRALILENDKTTHDLIRDIVEVLLEEPVPPAVAEPAKKPSAETKKAGKS